jgi:hypothetical protein
MSNFALNDLRQRYETCVDRAQPNCVACNLQCEIVGGLDYLYQLRNRRVLGRGERAIELPDERNVFDFAWWSRPFRRTTGACVTCSRPLMPNTTFRPAMPGL